MSRKFTDLSPERVRPSVERSPRYNLNPHCNNKNSIGSSHRHQHQQQCGNNNKVSVVYYLCKNQQLEHPHFMEVALSSPDGLHLRDVIERLNALRGRGIASTYSWSCKRLYKNGYVWQDLCEEDLIVPAHGNEYVLKGSEIFEAHGESNNSIGEEAKPVAKDVRNETVSTPASTSSEDLNTLESLIKADLRKRMNLRALKGESNNLPTCSDARINASKMILQLISCGSLAVKDGGCGLITEKPRFLKIPSLGENPPQATAAQAKNLHSL